MSTWAIVPVKPFNYSKSRLARALSAGESETLSRSFFEHTLAVLSEVPEIERTLVVSRDTEALTLARARGALSVTESGAPELNRALTRATQAAISFGARSVLVLPTDLPLVTAAEVRLLVGLEVQDNLAVIAPDRRGLGTNALVVRPPLLFDYAFGPASFRRHCELAKASGARVRVCRLAALGLDVDQPEDLNDYRELAARPA